MTLRLIEVFATPGHMNTIEGIARHFRALTFRREPEYANGTEEACRIVARPERQQELIDQLQGALGKEGSWRITIIPVEATIPEPEAEEGSPSPEQATREELYVEIDRGARMDTTFLQLVILSTIVAAIGLLENDIAIVIAAMLIAPLLGPNVAMAFGSTLGDRELVVGAAITNIAGVALSVFCAAAAALLVPVEGSSVELMARTKLGYDSIVLALASGAAGALSLTTRLPSTLVGVMVAVALLPPAVALGYTLATAQFRLAAGAGALLAVNIVCVNLAAQLVFLSKGIKPRTWIERRAAQQSAKISLAITAALLAVLVGIIAWRQG